MVHYVAKEFLPDTNLHGRFNTCLGSRSAETVSRADSKSWPIRERQHLQMKANLNVFPIRKTELRNGKFALDFKDVAA